MKRIAGVFTLTMAGIALALASGCAALQVDAPSSTPRAEASAQSYVNAVNRNALRRGYQVRWIHPPRDR